MGVFQSIYAIGLASFTIAVGLFAECISMRAAYYCLAFCCIVACIVSGGWYIQKKHLSIAFQSFFAFVLKQNAEKPGRSQSDVVLFRLAPAGLIYIITMVTY